ncbi:hypothetical protein Hanom_Chr10g00874071 [Helianthus anomalus]
MGAVCCCLHYDYEDYVNPNSNLYRNCICLRCFLQNFLYLEEGDPLRGSDNDMETDPLCAGNKWNNLTCEDETKRSHTKSSVKLSTPKEAT